MFLGMISETEYCEEKKEEGREKKRRDNNTGVEGKCVHLSEPC